MRRRRTEDTAAGRVGLPATRRRVLEYYRAALRPDPRLADHPDPADVVVPYQAAARAIVAAVERGDPVQVPGRLVGYPLERLVVVKPDGTVRHG